MLKNGKLTIYSNAKPDKAHNVVYEHRFQQATSIKEPVTNIEVGDFFKVINGHPKGFYAVVIAESYGDEIEINYFQKSEKSFVIKKNDFDRLYTMALPTQFALNSIV